jgi:hypothetical protein
MTTQPDRDTGQRRRSAPKTSPANRPTRAQDKASPPRAATPSVRTLPRDTHEADERSLPQPFHALAFGVGAVIGTTTKLAEEAWHAGGRLLDRVRGDR